MIGERVAHPATPELKVADELVPVRANRMPGSEWGRLGSWPSYHGDNLHEEQLLTAGAKRDESGLQH